MRAVVRSVFYGFNEPMEGAVPWLYQDVKGLVSVGVGILTDPKALCLGLPFLRLSDGQPASRQEISDEWDRIKSLPPNNKGQTAAQLGHLYAHPHTRLRLSSEGLRSTLDTKLMQMDTYLRNRFPEYEQWPSDAQLGVLSLSWACGPAFRFPRCEQALRDWDFRVAAVECFMLEERTISGLRPRNKVNRLLFTNAAIVVEKRLDPETLHWPTSLDSIVPAKEPAVRPDQLEPEPAIVHPLSYPYEPDDEPPDAA